MKIPKRLKVAGVTYSIVLIKNQETVSDEFLYGNANHRICEIKINGDCPPDVQQETFFHEAIHALNQRYGLCLEEAQVKTLGAGVHQILKDNKLLRE